MPKYVALNFSNDRTLFLHWIHGYLNSSPQKH